MSGEDASAADRGRQPRPPSLLDAALPVVVLIVLIAITIWLFGVSATDGPLQVALLLSALLHAVEPGQGVRGRAGTGAGRGGSQGIYATVWLILAALSFAAILEHAGFLERLLRPVVNKARSRGQLIGSVNASGVGPTSRIATS